jgi:hypothetical protein
VGVTLNNTASKMEHKKEKKMEIVAHSSNVLINFFDEITKLISQHP